ncbi:MAG TPA: DUF6506 family protein [Mesorhizobium sp.]|nr:DUF6506 family protein [Mesorhizobium sp.]
MSLQAAFIFLAPEADANNHRAMVRTPQVELTVVGVANYAEAERAAKSLVDQGIAAIELRGFGVAGAARIARAVDGKAAAGVVRFDGHPGLGEKSGDATAA